MVRLWGKWLFTCGTVLAGCTLFLVGWSHQQTDRKVTLSTITAEIDALVDQQNWQQAVIKGKELQEFYKRKKWQLQLLGDEQEYEGLNEDIQKLRAALSEKDKTEAKMQLAEINDLLENIYSL